MKYLKKNHNTKIIKPLSDFYKPIVSKPQLLHFGLGYSDQSSGSSLKKDDCSNLSVTLASPVFNNLDFNATKEPNIIPDKCIGGDIICSIIKKISSKGIKEVKLDDSIKVNIEDFLLSTDKVQYIINLLGDKVCSRIGRECKAALFNFFHSELGKNFLQLKFAEMFALILNKSNKCKKTYEDIYKNSASHYFNNAEGLTQKHQNLFRCFLAASRTGTQYGDDIYNAMNLLPILRLFNNSYYMSMTQDNVGNWRDFAKGSSTDLDNSALEVFTKAKYLFEPFFNHEKVKEDFKVIYKIIGFKGNCIFADAKQECEAMLMQFKSDLKKIDDENFRSYVLDIKNAQKREVISLLNKLQNNKFPVNGILSFAFHDLLTDYPSSIANIPENEVCHNPVINISWIKKHRINLDAINIDETNIEYGCYIIPEEYIPETSYVFDEYRSFIINCISQLEEIIEFHVLSDCEKSKVIDAMNGVVCNLDKINDQIYFEALGVAFQHLFSIEVNEQNIFFSQILDKSYLPVCLTRIDTKNVSSLYRNALDSFYSQNEGLFLISKKHNFNYHADLQLLKINDKFDPLKDLPDVHTYIGSTHMHLSELLELSLRNTSRRIITDVSAEMKFFDVFGSVVSNIDEFEKRQNFFPRSSTSITSIKSSEVKQLVYNYGQDIL